MGSYATLSKVCDLGKKARQLGYCPETIAVLEDTLSEDTATYRALKSCTFQADSRSVMMFAKDLVANWCIEDSLLQALQNAGLDIELNGVDKERKILEGRNVRATADYKLDGQPLELVTNYTNWWTRTGKIQLRDNKYKNLKKEGALLLCLELRPEAGKRFAIIDLSKECDARFIKHHAPWGNRSAYELRLEQLTPWSIKNFKIMLDNVRRTTK